MHFSKTYSQLLLTLPDELQSSAIEYRQLKKLINELVTELESLGLSPLILHQLLQASDNGNSSIDSMDPSRGRHQRKGKERAHGERLYEVDFEKLLAVPTQDSNSSSRSPSPAKMVYELADEDESGDIVSRLRLWVGGDTAISSSTTVELPANDQDQNHPAVSQTKVRTETIDADRTDAGSRDERRTLREHVVMMSSLPQPQPAKDLLWSLQERAAIRGPNSWNASHDSTTLLTDNSPPTATTDNSQEVVIPLASDVAFFRLLTTALTSLSLALEKSRDNFTTSIQLLSAAIARTSRPASAKGKSDLYTWRSIFQLYMEAQVFESTSERDRGERSVEESEERLALFARKVGEGGFSLGLPESRSALQNFLELNVQLMNLKKFQSANAEAARKILKKHSKRTSLPLPSTATELIPSLELGQVTAKVPHVLVVALTETLMPVVPHIDDYICLICFAIAFKPIRLQCGHLFCVRCLVKMQKQGKDNCPMCRAPTVVIANKSNIDHALVNFMHDWFPKETKEKAKANECESAREEMEELGLPVDTKCVIM